MANAMQRPDLAASLTRPFLETGGELADSLLYLDAGAAEAVKSILGLQALLALHVVHVCDLDRAGPMDKEVCSLLSAQGPTKIYILTTQLLTDTHSAILHVLQAHPQAESCVVWCSISEDAHASQPLTTLGEDPYVDFETALTGDLAEMRSKSAAASCPVSISIRSFPLHACALTDDIFVLPSASSAARMARAGGKLAGFSAAERAQHGAIHAAGRVLLATLKQIRNMAERIVLVDDGSNNGNAGLKLQAHALAGLAANMQLRLDTFSLGPTSHLLGEEVCSLVPPAGPNGRAPRGTAGLLLVDRHLDLMTPVIHADHILDRIFGSLPRGQDPADPSARLPEQPSNKCRPIDVSVDWLEQDSAEKDHREASTSGAPESSLQQLKRGFLFPIAADRGSQILRWLDVLLGQKEKDALLYLRKWLKDALRKEGLQPKERFKGGSVSTAEITSLAKVLSDNPTAALHQWPVLRLALAAVAALTGPAAGKWALLGKQEKQLALLSMEGPEAIMNELLAIVDVATRSRRLDVDDLLQLIIAGYALAADAVPSAHASFTPEQERELRDALVQAILQADLQVCRCTWLGALHERIVQHQSDASVASSPERQEDAAYHAKALCLELQDTVEGIISSLRDVSISTQKLPRSLRAATEEAGEMPAPLLHRLIVALADGRACPEFQHHTASLRGLLNSGLTRFGIKQKEPKPTDYNTVIIFVVGGISMADARAARAALQAGAPPQQKLPHIIIGGTSLLSPADVIQDACCEDVGQL